MDIPKQNIQKTKPANIYASISYPFQSKEREEFCAIFNKSSKPMIETNDVSLNNAMKVFTIEGIDIRNACGKIINIVCCPIAHA